MIGVRMVNGYCLFIPSMHIHPDPYLVFRVKAESVGRLLGIAHPDESRRPVSLSPSRQKAASLQRVLLDTVPNQSSG